MRQTNESAAAGTEATVPGVCLVTAVVTLILALGCGCSVLHSAATLPTRTVRTITGTKTTGAYDPVLLQQRLMRFADDYSGRLQVVMDSLPPANDSTNAIARLRLKLNYVESIYAVTTGPNELMNLADMFVLVTLTKAIVQEESVPGFYGESARALVAAVQQGDTNITAIALTVVSPKQLDELRAAIARWRQEHPGLRSALFARSLGFEVEIAARRKDPKTAPGSLFSLFWLDPLVGLDPAARELAQTRLFGERALFLAQRKPTLLRWHTELTVLETASTQPMLELRTNANQIAEALLRASKTMERLPGFVSSERQAVFNELPSQEPALTNLAAQLTTVLEAGTRMSDSLDATLNTAAGIQQTAAAESARKTKKTGAVPKRPGLQEYTQSAKQVGLVAQQLDDLLQTVNHTLAPTNVSRLSTEVTPVMQQAQAGGRAVADYVFHRALLLVGFTCVAVLLTALLWLWIRRRASIA